MSNTWVSKVCSTQCLVYSGYLQTLHDNELYFIGMYEIHQHNIERYAPYLNCLCMVQQNSLPASFLDLVLEVQSMMFR